MKFIFGAIGLVILYQMMKDLLMFIFNMFFGRKRDLISKYGKNSYVVVTGGSEGIGLSLAKEFAKRGFNIILISRNQLKLDNAKKIILSINQNVNVITASFDFGTIDDKSSWDFGKVVGIDFSKIDVSVLVNNVGVKLGKDLLNATEAEILNLVKINCIAQTILTTFFARIFRKRERKSAVLNINSMTSVNNFPGMGLYGATKMFNLALNEEQGNFDNQIDYYCFVPAWVSTRHHDFKTGPLMVDPDTCADFGMRNFGSARYVFAGHPLHEVIKFVVSCIPNRVLGFLGKIKNWKKKTIATN